jgi:hypothetical protein
MIPKQGTSSCAARQNECEQRGHNVGAINDPDKGEIVFLCAKCGLSLAEIRGEEKSLVTRA